MVDSAELQTLIKGLMVEYDALVTQREAVRQQEEALKKQGVEMDRKLVGLKQSLEGLSLYTTAKNEPPSLTKEERSVFETLTTLAVPQGPRISAKTLSECCREILVRSGEWLTPLQVRQGLHAAGFNFSEYKSNPLSSIHTTLKRIAESGQAWTQDADGETFYKWKKEGEKVVPILEIPKKAFVQLSALRVKPGKGDFEKKKM